VHSIGVGKWRDKVDAALARSAVCVAVIGPHWANADNLPRLKAKGDMVRHELVTALASADLTLGQALVALGDLPAAPQAYAQSAYAGPPTVRFLRRDGGAGRAG